MNNKSLNIVLAICILSLTGLVSCKKSEKFDEDLQPTVLRNVSLANNEIGIISYEYVNNTDNTSSYSYVAKFGIPSNGNFVGNVSINGYNLFYDNLSNRYVSLDSHNPTGPNVLAAPNMAQTIPSIGYLNVKSNLSQDIYFQKNADLTLSWTPFGSNEQIKIAICAEGSPCIIKTANEFDGNLTVPSSEFSGFGIGKHVVVYVTLNKEYNFNQNSDLTCINTGIVSRSSGHIVQ